MSHAPANVLPIAAALVAGRGAAQSIVRVTFLGAGEDGRVRVLRRSGEELACLVLDTGAPPPSLQHGDELLALVGPEPGDCVVLGKIAPYKQPGVPTHLQLEASESLTLRAGSASVDLRADGKVMIRGEDVLVRAKGTQRIRAGTVSIN